jgi:hypothetical protein
MDNPGKALSFALEKYPERVELIVMRELLIESARQNEKRPAWVKLAVPDAMVKSLKGAPQPDQDLVLVVRVPREVLQRSESRILLPGEIGRP